MITANGKLQIQRYLAQKAGSIGGSLALGAGSKAANVNDVSLEYEVVRVPILSINTDPTTGNLVFRTQFNPGQIKTAYEIGLWSSATVGGESYTLGLLNDVPVAWTNATLTSTNARANTTALQVSYVANGTTNAERTGFLSDLSRFTDADSITFAYYVTINMSSLRIRLGTDSTNYYEFLMPAHTANSYNVAKLSKSAATKTGSPDWAAIKYMAIRPSATAGGSGNIYFDGAKFEPNNLITDNLLVARSVLSTPYDMDANIPTDVEYSLRVVAA